MHAINYNHYYRKYEEQLSPFGKKVLQVLMKHRDKADRQNNNKVQYNHYPTQYERVIMFCEDSLDKPLYTRSVQTTPSELPCQVDQNVTNKLTDHFKTVPDTSDDFLHPTIAANENLVCKFYNTDCDDENKHNEVIPRKNSTSINWDDMLDSELLDNIGVNNVDQKRNERHNTFDIQFPNKQGAITEFTSKVVASEYILKRDNKRKNIKSADSKTKKARYILTEVENKLNPVDIPLLLKKDSTDKPKNNFRKQSYTKTVKNWLHNVEPHSADQGEIDNIVCDCDSNDTDRKYGTDEKGFETSILDKDMTLFPIKNLELKKEKPVINKTLKPTKKVLQAQLANKDGVMKFSKPKISIESIQILNTTDMKEKKLKDSVKEKSVKKFVPPIKSQIPLRDLTYDICTVTEENIEMYEDKLLGVENDEIVAVLIYSNGFCQLNSHHTDGACAADGLIISFDNVFYCFKGVGQKLKKVLTHIMENNNIICYGARDILIYISSLMKMEIYTINMYDAKIGASLLDPDNSPENFTDLQKLLSYTPQFTVATECMLQKCAWYMTLLGKCWLKLYAMLVEEALWQVLIDIEMKLLPIIVDMEFRGLLIDFVKLKSMEEVLLTQMKLVEQQCYKAAGKVFQINSALQVRSILYDELKLDSKCNVKIRETISKGAKSTNETMLRSLISEHPLPKLILEYRHLHKAHATFLMGIAQHVKDGVVRPAWVQNAAATGRIASNNPNLQAIPKAPFSLVMFPDANDSDKEHLKFRSVYISRAGHSFLAADFKHIECRVFAHAAADTELQHALSTSDDLFRVLAAKWLNKDEKKVVAEERERTKRLVYASLYGAGARKLMEILDASYEHALEVAASFNRTFPSLKSFGRAVCARCSSGGGRVRSVCGRARRLPHICSARAADRAHAERQAVNFVVQGSAADLCKTAMISTTERLRASWPALSAYLVLQLHDELVWEIRDQDVGKAAVIIKQVMEACGRQCGMSVALPVAISVGKNWGDMLHYSCEMKIQ